MPFRNCPSDQELLAFHLGVASHDALEEVAEHLEGCAHCEAALEKLDGSTDPVLAGLRRPVLGSSAAEASNHRPHGTGGERATSASVDLTTREPALAAYERSDVAVVPAAGVIGEAMVAIVLAQAFLEKFGGDSVGETKRNYDGYIEQVKSF